MSHDLITTCEHCWWSAFMSGSDYAAEVLRAERDHAPCTRDDETGRRLRAGHHWDEEKKVDRRLLPSTEATHGE